MLKVLLNPAMIFLYLAIGLGIVWMSVDNEGVDSSILSSTHKSRGSLRPLKEAFNPVQPAEDISRLVDRLDFLDLTSESGINFTHRQTGPMLTSLNELTGSGVCTADIDRDGFLDIYIVNGSGYSHYYGKRWWWSKVPHNALYRNQKDGTFQDMAEPAGVANADWGMGCAFADYDNDGYADLYVTNYGANTLYHNNGDKTFTDVSVQAGVADERWSTAASWADYDNDGDLDLYVVNYIVFDKAMTPGEPNSAFKSVKPLLMNSGLFDGQKNVLYRNNGDGTFMDVTEQAGVANSPGKGMGAVFFDYDNDHDQDIYIANDHSRNVLYRNNSDGTFTDVGGDLGVDSPLSGMGVAIGDFDNDGDMDLFSTYPQDETNILYRNLVIHDGDDVSYTSMGFKDVSVKSGLGETAGVGYFGWSASFVDINSDGYLDLFVNNGHGMVDFDNPQTTIGQRNQIFLNNKKGIFYDVSGRFAKGLTESRSGRGAAVGDFDNDGDQDFFIVNNNAKVQWLVTADQTGNHWINIDLQGTKSNRDAIGAKVCVKAGPLVQTRQRHSGSGYLSQMDTRLHFGLGMFSTIESLEIVWPSGLTQRFEHIEADRFIKIKEGSNEIVFVRSPVTNPVEHATLRRDIKRETLSPDFEADATALLWKLEIIQAVEQAANEKNFQFVLGLLDHPNPQVRKAVVTTLNALGMKQAMDWLVPAFQMEKNIEVRRAIMQAADNLFNTAALELLLQGLGDHDTTIRQDATLTLKRLFEAEETIFRSSMLKKREVVTALLQALRDPDTIVRANAAGALGFSESYRSVMPVVEMFFDQDRSVRKAAVQASGFLRDKRAVDPLFDMLGNSQEASEVKVQAVFSLARLAIENPLNSLLVAAANGTSKEKLNAIALITAALKEKDAVLLKRDSVLRYLQTGTHDEDPAVRESALKLAELVKGNNMPAIVLYAINDPDLRVRRQAVKMGGKLNHPEILEKLKGFVHDNDIDIRREAILIFAKSAPNLIAPDEIALLQNIVKEAPEPQIRLAALSSLIKLKSTEAVALIVNELRQNSDNDFTRELIRILGSTSDATAFEPLLLCLEEFSYTEKQKDCITSLRRFAHKNNVRAVLVAIIQDPNKQLNVRQAALSVLVAYEKNKGGTNLFSLLSGVIKNKKDPLRKDLMSGFFDLKEKRLVPFLLDVWRDKTESAQIRKQALSMLAILSPKDVLAELE